MSTSAKLIVYVGAGSGPLRNRLIAAGHGQMVSRQTGAFRIPKHGRWTFDNGAWTDFLNNKPFGDKEFLKRLMQIEAAPEERWPDWCVCPDVVGFWMSLEYSIGWKKRLERMGTPFRWYLALQDYVRPEDVELALGEAVFDGLFIGGSTHWKLANGGAWVKWGHEHGLPVHIGRVNGPNRLQWAVNVGADSVDGTGWVRAGQAWIGYLLNLPEKERLLFELEPEFEWSGVEAQERTIQEELEWGEENLFYEREDRIREMTEDEFRTWVFNAYGLHPNSAPSEAAEFLRWKYEVLDLAERHMWPRFWSRPPERGAKR